MSADQKPACPTAIPEHSRVRLTRKVGGWPAGTVGTVVHVYPHCVAYEVEFNLAEPEDDWRERVVTVNAEHLEAMGHD